HVLQALGRGAGCAAQQDRVAEYRDAVLALQAEMADPQPLICQRQQLVQRGAALLRDLQIERAGEVHRADLVRPGEPEAVIAPATWCLCRHLRIAAPVE